MWARTDPHLPLIIDPVLTYSTYLGGSSEERVGGIAFDAQGNIYVAGMTSAADFPATAPPAMSHGRDGGDAFVVKLNATGDQFLYATYIGGSDYEQPAGLAVDGDGNVYLAGQTYSWDFPTLNGIQSSRRGLTDGFVAKLDPNGVVVYSTYLGGSGEDRASGIAVDALGRAYVSGSTLSADFPTANALQPALGGHPAFRTTDGGQTWAGIGSGLRASWVRAFAIDPVNTQIVYAGTGSDGVLRALTAARRGRRRVPTFHHSRRTRWSSMRPVSYSLPTTQASGEAVMAAPAGRCCSCGCPFRRS